MQVHYKYTFNAIDESFEIKRKKPLESGNSEKIVRRVKKKRLLMIDGDDE